MIKQPLSPLANLLRIAICMVYFLGGIIGLYVLVPQIALFLTSWLAIFLFSLMILQNVIAVYGSILLFKKNNTGGRMLYWLSWTSVPVFSSAMISYHSIIGLGVTPIMRFAKADYGMEILFQFGYDGILKWFPTYDVFQLGINLVPLIFIGILRQLIQLNQD